MERNHRQRRQGKCGDHADQGAQSRGVGGGHVEQCTPRSGPIPGVYPDGNREQEFFMKVKIGIAESNRVVELEIEDVESFESMLGEQFADMTGLIWFEDTKDRRVGVPKAHVTFVEIDKDRERTVGFGS